MLFIINSKKGNYVPGSPWRKPGAQQKQLKGYMLGCFFSFERLKHELFSQAAGSHFEFAHLGLSGGG